MAKLFSIGDTYSGPCAYVAADSKEEAYNKWAKSSEYAEDRELWEYAMGIDTIEEVNEGVYFHSLY